MTKHLLYCLPHKRFSILQVHRFLGDAFNMKFKKWFRFQRFSLFMGRNAFF